MNEKSRPFEQTFEEQKSANNRLRIAFLTALNPLDKRSWSCSLYYMYQALQRHCGDVTCLGPLKDPEPSLLSQAMAKSSLALFKRRFLHEKSLATARQWGCEVMQKLAGQTFDVIISTSSEPALIYLQTDIPIVLVSDTVFTRLLDYYPYYSHLSKRSLWQIRFIEHTLYRKVQALLMSSAWAARCAIQDYAVNPEHVYAIEFGANLDSVPDRAIAGARKPSDTCRLLFSGVEWQRKGGDIAFETLLKLEEMGMKAELIVCGCVPPTGLSHPRMRVIPYLDKNDKTQASEIERLYATSDFLILPTRADCAPNVIKEANAFGLPVIASNTGGIPDLIHSGENGYVLPLTARGDSYAGLIAAIYQNEQRYTRLAQSSRAAFEERLNWDVWGRRVHDVLLKELGVSGEVSTTAGVELEETVRG